MDQANENERALTAALRAVANQDAGRVASASVEERLRSEVRSIAARRRRRYATALAVAAGLLIVAAVPARWMTRRQAVTSSTAADSDAARARAAVSEVSTAFLPLAYSSVPITNGQLVRLEVPRAALASFGLAPIEFLDSPSAGTVTADVIVGEDGLARAVRFVRPAGRAAQQEQKP
jgi:anti-sigma factor RsiW